MHPNRDIIDRVADARDLTLWLADGYEPAIVGIWHRKDCSILLYNVEGCLKALQDDTHGEGMDETEAVEWFEFNSRPAWMGPNSPVYMDADDSEDEDCMCRFLFSDHFKPAVLGYVESSVGVMNAVYDQTRFIELLAELAQVTTEEATASYIESFHKQELGVAFPVFVESMESLRREFSDPVSA